jgi:trans-aconitate 2-methyltransferase
VIQAIKEAGDGWPGPWLFATPEETHSRLEKAGVVDVETWCHDERISLEAGEALERHLATVMGAHLGRLREKRRAAFVNEIARRLPRPEIDCVRLNIIVPDPIG